MNNRQDAARTKDHDPRDGRRGSALAQRLARWVHRLLPAGIRQRLFLLIVVAAVPMVILEASLYAQRHDARRKQAMDTESEVAQGIAMTFAAYLDGLHRQLDVIGKMILSLPPDSEATIERALKITASEHPSLEGVNWVSPEGRILVSNLPQGVGRDISARAHFQQILAGQLWAVGDLMELGAILDNPIVAVAVAVHDEDGQLIGVVAAGIEPTRLGELTFPHERRTGGVYTIFDRQGQLIYRNPPVPLTWRDRLRWQFADPLLRQALAGQVAQGVVTSKMIGERQIAARVPISDIGWVAGAASPMEAVMRPVRQALFQDAVVGVLITSLALALAAFAAHTIAEPLRRLEQDAGAMGGGVIETSSDLQSPVEVRSLRGTVTAMAAGLMDRAEALRQAKDRLQEQTEELQVQAEELQAQTEELRITNEVLQRREREYRTLAENTPEVIARLDRKFRHTYINEYGARVYGMSREKVFGKTNTELGMPADKVAFWEEHFEQVLATGRQQTAEFEFDSPTFGPQHFLAVFVPEFDGRGEVVSILVITRDVTEQVHSQQALRASEERHRRLIENLKGSHFVYVHDTQGVFQYISESITGILGYAPEEFMAPYGTYLTDHPANEAVRRYTELSIQGIRQPPFQVHTRHKDGSTRWLEVQEVPVLDDEGKVVAVEGVAQDITERKRAEEALRESEQWFRTLANTTPQLVWTAEPDGRVDYYNERYKEYSGIEQMPDGSFHWAPVLHPDDVAPTAEAWERAVRTGETYQIEHRVQRADGSYHWHLSRGMAVRNEEGRVVKWFGTATDIDDFKQAQEGLRRLTETLESRVVQRTAELEYRTQQLQKLTLELSQTEDRERRRLADILHDDLQQQLAAVKFHLGLLSNRVRADASLRKTAAQLDRMLSDAIETSRSLSHELSPAMLYQAGLDETFEWLAGQIRSKHGLDVRVCADGEIRLESDALKAFLYKAAQEMLFNVVKHARVGKAVLRVRRMEGCICLVVSDRGRGFDPQDLKVAAGFGLFSIRERVQLLGGRMKIKSAPGKGCTVFIAVPDRSVAEDLRQIMPLGGRMIEDRREPSSVLRSPPSGRLLRVLVADDHEVVRQGLATLLREQQDIQFVGEAANGREAVDMASRLRPDVVIMDVAMPLMNGDEATRQTKLHLPGTRVVALSMYAEDGMIERMRRAGADAYILKTAPSEELLAAVRGQTSHA
jgi:PAS domain S-box-containing protein